MEALKIAQKIIRENAFEHKRVKLGLNLIRDNSEVTVCSIYFPVTVTLTKKLKLKKTFTDPTTVSRIYCIAVKLAYLSVTMTDR